MWHATCTQINHGDSWCLMVKSQIGNLIHDPPFGHNLCFKCPNGSCKPVLDIYVLKVFQIFNPMSFDLVIAFWRFESPLGLQFPKWDSLRNVGVHSLTLSYPPDNIKCDSWASVFVHTFASPCFGREPKMVVNPTYYPPTYPPFIYLPTYLPIFFIFYNLPTYLPTY